eukprot:508127-Pelagomonas_calceolata.AAC.7
MYNQLQPCYVGAALLPLGTARMTMDCWLRGAPECMIQYGFNNLPVRKAITAGLVVGEVIRGSNLCTSSSTSTTWLSHQGRAGQSSNH